MAAFIDPYPRRTATGAFIAGAAGLLLMLVVAAALPFALGAAEGHDPASALRWYGALATEERWRLAARNSLAVAAGAAFVATLAGSALALAVRFGRASSRTTVVGVALAPALLPAACVAVAMLAALSAAGMAGRFRGLVLAHAAVGVPFVFAAVLVAVRPLGTRMLRTAASLGAPPGMVFWHVVLPLAWPGVAAGALLAFTASFGDVAVAGLLSPPGQPTVPRSVLAALRDAPGPDAYAVGVLLVLCCLLAAGAALLLLRTRLAMVFRGPQVGY